VTLFGTCASLVICAYSRTPNILDSKIKVTILRSHRTRVPRDRGNSNEIEKDLTWCKTQPLSSLSKLIGRSVGWLPCVDEAVRKQIVNTIVGADADGMLSHRMIHAEMKTEGYFFRPCLIVSNSSVGLGNRARVKGLPIKGCQNSNGLETRITPS
jgi:hypothetical protein